MWVFCFSGDGLRSPKLTTAGALLSGENPAGLSSVPARWDVPEASGAEVALLSVPGTGCIWCPGYLSQLLTFPNLLIWLTPSLLFLFPFVLMMPQLSGAGETPAYHYGTHYSSAMIVASYLVRMEPFTQIFLRLQVGKTQILNFYHSNSVYFHLKSSFLKKNVTLEGALWSFSSDKLVIQSWAESC